MKKRLYILYFLIAITCLLGMISSVYAEQLPAPYPAAFWVNGVLDPGATDLTADQLAGFQVYVYTQSNNYPQAYSLGTAQSGGAFAVNALDDLQMNPIQAQRYYIGVTARTVGGKSYGVNQKVLEITQVDVNSGFKNLVQAFLMIRENEGISTEVDTGIYIRRKADTPGSAIEITWDPARIGNPRIFAMTGDGTGQYDNNPSVKWTQLIDENGMVLVNNYNGGNVTYNNNVFEHANQVGQGAPEEYYKVYAGEIQFTKAPAVGKLDLTIYGDPTTPKYNLVSTPFLANARDLTETFSSQLSRDKMEVYSFDNLAQRYAHAAYSGKWVWPVNGSNQPVPITVARGKAYWLYNPLTDIPITVVGGVPSDDKSLSAAFYSGGKYNIFALPQCWSGTLAEKGLTAQAGSELYKFNNKGQRYQHLSYDSVAQGWSQVVVNNVATDLRLEIGGGLWYYNNSGSAVTFNP